MALVGSLGDQRGEDLSTGTATGAGRVTECPGGCVSGYGHVDVCDPEKGTVQPWQQLLADGC